MLRNPPAKAARMVDGLLIHVLRGLHSLRPILAFGCVLVPGTLFPAAALADTELTLLFDTDRNPVTGCWVKTSQGVFAGAERKLRTTIDSDTHQVTGVFESACNTAQYTFGSEKSVRSPSPPWNTMPGGGVLGGTLVETHIPLSDLANAPSVRVGAILQASGSGGEDVLFTDGGASSQAPSIVVSTQQGALVPGLPALATLLLALALLWLAVKHVPAAAPMAPPVLLAIVLSGPWLARAATGALINWTASKPDATDAAFDAPGMVDMVALFAVADPESDNLYVRVDVLPTGPSQGTAPRLVAGTFIGDSGASNPTANQSARNILWSRTGGILVSGLGGAGAPVTSGAYQTTYAGDGGRALGGDCWVGRLSENLSSLTAATFYGGPGEERPCYGLAELSNGNIVIAGSTGSDTGIATAGSAMPTRPAQAGLSTGFAAVLSRDLRQRLAGTYIGGAGNATIRGGIRVLANGDLLAYGQVDGDGLGSLGALQWSPSGGFNEAWIGALSPDLSRQRWGTYLGGASPIPTEVFLGADELGGDIVAASVSPSTAWLNGKRTGGAVGTGADVARPYVVRFTPGVLQRRAWLTVLGRGEGAAQAGGDAFPEAGLARDRNDNFYMAGGTETSMGTPGTLGTTLRGQRDCYVCRVSSSGGLDWCTHVGGSGADSCIGPSVTAGGNIVITGTTDSPDMCSQARLVGTTQLAGNADAFVAVLSSDGARLEWCTLLGGSGEDVGRMTALRQDGRLLVSGLTESPNFPVTAGAFDSTHNGNADMFVVLFDGLQAF